MLDVNEIRATVYRPDGSTLPVALKPIRSEIDPTPLPDLPGMHKVSVFFEDLLLPPGEVVEGTVIMDEAGNEVCRIPFQFGQHRALNRDTLKMTFTGIKSEQP